MIELVSLVFVAACGGESDWYNEDTGEWDGLPTAIDEAANIATVEVALDHMSIFTIAVESPVSAESMRWGDLKATYR